MPPEAPEVEAEEPEPDPQPAPEHEEAPSPPPDTIAPPEPVPEPAPPRVAVVLSERNAPFQKVAAEIEKVLPRPLIYNLADKSLSREEAFLGIADSAVDVVIAVGLPATVASIELSTVPVVYCQVFNFVVPNSTPVPVKGVSSIPPLSLQLRAWRELKPDLEVIGTIVGAGHDDLLEEALDASAEHGLSFDYRIAGNDRETLYLFKRLAPNIDGFWLFPDNRVLSIPVLREMLASASRYDVQIAVFNAALLELGAAVSGVSVESDIARTAVAIARQLAAGETESIPALTPLSEIDVRTREFSGSGSAKGMQ